jgi:hypothetical protein|tara:strand:- start:170 stop:370 length:201 start_codon:yes stop_codon:yes gene_type:complete
MITPRIGSIVRLKSSPNPRFLGLVKGYQTYGDPTVDGDYSVLLKVLWFYDLELNFKPWPEEVEVVS